MRAFLVERHIQGVDLQHLPEGIARVEAETVAKCAAAVSIFEWLGSTFLPEDEDASANYDCIPDTWQSATD